MSDAKEVEFSLKVLINKEKNKVLFAEADSHFVDILLSFLTLPLGRIIKVLEKHYGDEAPVIGSLTTLYHSLVNLDNADFWTEGAKLTLLNPQSSFEAEYKSLKLDITDSPPAEYFVCAYHSPSCTRVRSVSMYYDNANGWKNCYKNVRTEEEVVEKGSQAAATDGVFTMHRAPFIISDDLQIFPNVRGLLQIISILGIADMMDKAESIKVTLGFSEIMDLLKASLISPTPLSDLILNKTKKRNSVIMESEPKTLHQIENQENPNSKKIILKVVVRNSSGELLYAQAEEDFVEFLFSFFNIPLGGVEHLVGGRTCSKAIDNLYQSTTVIDDKYFKTPNTKIRLMKPNVVHGCISEDQILPLIEERLPAEYCKISWSSSVKFPKGQGSYLQGLGTYQVTDDLTVTPFCFASICSSLSKQRIPISDVKEVELQIGLKEACSILKASLTSTTVLTDALLNHISIKQPKPEH